MIEREGCDECFPAMVSSKACHVCGRRAIITRKEVERHLLDWTWASYAIGEAMHLLNPDQGESPDPALANQWLRTTLPKNHPSYVDPKTLGYGMRS